jgi:RimJ/RimL family protein N-acetyltransferase
MSAPNDSINLQPFARRHLTRTLAWTNDPTLSRLLNRARPVSPEEHERWFASLPARTDTIYLAIELADGEHIGNVWLADIDRRHRKAEMRVVLGAQNSTDRGFGSRALDLAARYAFDVTGLHRVYAYVLAVNPRARRAFEKAGFALEGVLKDDRWIGDVFSDVLLLARLAG